MQRKISENANNSSPSLFLVCMLTFLFLISIGLMLVQATDYAILEIPQFLINLINSIPGPSAKISSLRANGYYESAIKFEVYISLQISLLVLCIIISVPYTLIKSIKPFINVKDNKSYNNYNLEKLEIMKYITIIFGIISSYFLFFESGFDYNNEGIFYPNNIHESVFGYVRYVASAVTLFLIMIGICMWFNQKLLLRKRTNGQ